MKVPMTTPLEQLRSGLMTLQNKTLIVIANFRSNILHNRDLRRERPTKMSDNRELTIVPYEEKSKVVDNASFAYALEASITESDQTQTRPHSKLLRGIKNFFYHPLRVLAALIIIILSVYIALMFVKATNTNQNPISNSQPQYKTKN
ncbi:MAG: hypothetical protein ABF709_02945 [Leuconostoc pseudomesenteroides]|uniref:hypothetical protein n=1 Tax=Leuconostoc pseudomesenteroides TaxID=33968 RepID=UPI0039E78463